jgi:aryl-alcohol dehydrogenase-like predicted oxidoreductase
LRAGLACRHNSICIRSIPGTTKPHRLEENIGAVEVELTPDDLRDIGSTVSKITVQGKTPVMEHYLGG